MSTSSTHTITINDVTYHSIDEVPDNLRHLVEDKNNDGMPDHFEHLINQTKSSTPPPTQPPEPTTPIQPKNQPTLPIHSDQKIQTIQLISITLGLGIIIGLIIAQFI